MNDFNDFLGRGWSFPPQFSKAERGVHMVSDEQDIYQSLRILFGTQLGERFLQPEFGLDMLEVMFNDVVSARIREMIFDAVYEFEPRIKPLSIDIEHVPEDGQLIVHFDYLVKATNARHNMVYPFYLKEGTLI